MIDHVSLQCTDVGTSAAFYDVVLATIGSGRVHDFGDTVGFGSPEAADFWIGPHTTGEGFRETHIAFSARDRAEVQAFYDAAVAHGAEILNAPKVWPEYSPNYFAVFVRDPDGNNIEAVCHEPQ
jgi:catechol 2,3-dioxygenase-like lactoylglutathione lyase family enzyme